MNFQYKSFYWCLGTTSFRTKNFNKRIEQQLSLLQKFWTQEENIDEDWSGNENLQTAYYDFLRAENFMTGNAPNKAKDAREKTSGLFALGLIDENRRLTSIGQELLTLSEQNNFAVNNLIGIPADSFIYFKQLLKTSIKFDEEKIIRPFIVTLYLISKFGGISYDEYKYLLPLVTDSASAKYIVEKIQSLRKNETDIDEIILNRILTGENYIAAQKYFLNVETVTEEVIIAIGMNRKSRKYDKPYFALYVALKNFYLDKNAEAAADILKAIKKITNTGALWKNYLFGKTSGIKIKNDPLKYLCPTRFDNAANEKEFRRAFFATMHVIKVKRSLSDYFDLNRRYMKTADILLFDDDKVTLDIIPRHYFAPIYEKLLSIAFDSSPLLKENCNLGQIAEFLKPIENTILDGINREFSLELKSLGDADKILENQRYIRLQHLIDSKFTDGQLSNILSLISVRNDDEIQKLVTDNADIPTIFEYVLGILWYKISNRKGKILDYMKLSLDADLLPKTHAAGGEADIVYEYEKTSTYPAHSLLLEATLSDKANQRRMEMEPVSRHLGNHILRTKNLSSYCVFATNDLNINVISDFRSRKNIPYYDTSNVKNFIEGMKIIPLQIEDLQIILEKHFDYENLYPIFESAFKSTLPPHEWHEKCICDVLKK